MKFWERIAVQAQQEIYYYDTHRGFDARNLAGRLYEMILDELDRGKKGVVFLCIGTDRSTGDSLGPLIGYKLKGRQNQDIQVFGTLERPVHAMNLDDYMHFLQEDYSDHAVVAIDASVGKSDHVGYVTLGRGALKPGLGVSKELRRGRGDQHERREQVSTRVMENTGRDESFERKCICDMAGG